MSVDTNVKGKNLAAYRRVNAGDEGLKVLVSPQLIGLASRMVITVSSGFRKKLAVELSHPGGGDS